MWFKARNRLTILRPPPHVAQYSSIETLIDIRAMAAHNDKTTHHGATTEIVTRSTRHQPLRRVFKRLSAPAALFALVFAPAFFPANAAGAGVGACLQGEIPVSGG